MSEETEKDVVEVVTPEHVDKRFSSSEEEKVGVISTMQLERDKLLASLPDPDEGKTEEERKEIVRFPSFTHDS